MSEQYVLVIDEGTTGTRAVIVDRESTIKGQAYREFTQYNPGPDRVEHDPEEIWQASLAMITRRCRTAASRSGTSPLSGSPASAPRRWSGTGPAVSRRSEERRVGKECRSRW